MTLAEMDAQLADWQAHLAQAGSNLIELDDLFTYKRLRGEIGETPPLLTGTTAARVIPALAAIQDIWQYLQMLQDLLRRAQELRKSVRLWTQERVLHDIETMLTGPSLSLGTTKKPLALRGLLSTSVQTETVTPSDVLQFMTRAFEMAKDTILEVDVAWKRLEPTLSDCETQLAALTADAAALGSDAEGELAPLRAKLKALYTRVVTDPLGVNSDLAKEFRPGAERVRARLSQIVQQRSEALALGDRAAALLDELKETNRRCAAALAECRGKIDRPDGLRSPLPTASLDDLQSWLQTLVQTLQKGNWQAAQVGLTRWLETAQNHLAAERASLAANSAPLDSLAELRGRLSSLRAKASAILRRGAPPDPALEAMAMETERLLNLRPAPLTAADAAFSAYEKRLNLLLRNVSAP